MKRMESKKVLAILCFILSVAFQVSAKDKIIESLWTDQPVKIDGLVNEWKDDTLSVEGKVKVDFAFKNNDDFLFAIFRFNDVKYLSTIEYTGITLWINTQGKKKKSLGVKFTKKKLSADEYIALLEQRQSAVSEEQKQKLRQSAIYLISQAETVDKNGEPLPQDMQNQSIKGSKLPSNYGVIITYVSFLNKAGQYEAILEVLEGKWLPQMEHDPEIWNYLGLAYSNAGDLENALKTLEQALSIDDEFAFTYRNVGNIHLSQFQKTKNRDSLDKAIQNYEKAVELEPDYGAAFNSLGVAYKESGQPDKAIRCWEKAFELRPDVGYPLLNLGLAYMEKGNKTMALEYFVRYKKGFYDSLPLQDQKRVDALIQRNKREP